jgi:hypothetical protein
MEIFERNSTEFNNNSGHSKYVTNYEWMVQVLFLEEAGKTERYDSHFILWEVVLYRNMLLNFNGIEVHAI